jgi:hypothetical protein
MTTRKQRPTELRRKPARQPNDAERAAREACELLGFGEQEPIDPPGELGVLYEDGARGALDEDSTARVITPTESDITPPGELGVLYNEPPVGLDDHLAPPREPLVTIEGITAGPAAPVKPALGRGRKA